MRNIPWNISYFALILNLTCASTFRKASIVPMWSTDLYLIFSSYFLDYLKLSYLILPSASILSHPNSFYNISSHNMPSSTIIPYSLVWFDYHIPFFILTQRIPLDSLVSHLIPSLIFIVCAFYINFLSAQPMLTNFKQFYRILCYILLYYQISYCESCIILALSYPFISLINHSHLIVSFVISSYFRLGFSNYPNLFFFFLHTIPYLSLFYFFFFFVCILYHIYNYFILYHKYLLFYAPSFYCS